MFDISLKSHLNNIALLNEAGDTLSYGELDKLCQNTFNSLPLKKQLILIKASSNFETIIAYLSFLRRGDTVIMVDATMKAEMLDSIIENYSPNYIWAPTNFKKTEITFQNYSLYPHSTSPSQLLPSLALLLSTSGSTGSAKMVKLSKENIYANTDSITQFLPITSKDIAITSLPLYYSYGLSILHTHLTKGATILVSKSSILTASFWDLIIKYKVTSLQGVPYHYEMFKRIGFLKKEFPTLRYLTQAGGKLNHMLVEEFSQWTQKYHKKFYVMYGQTEATARMSYLLPKDIQTKSNSIGMAIKNGELAIHDPQTEQIITESYKEGELYYRGDNVMLGYAYTHEDLSRADEQKGLLKTGDIGYKDSDGFFYITGRVKRFIKIHGNRISLDMIESYLKAEGFSLYCTGVDDKLYIATGDKGSLSPIKDILKSHFGLHHTTFKIKYIDKFPFASNGKIQYQKLQELFK